MPTEPGAARAPQKNYVDTKIIATLFGLTARRIQQLTQDGILKTEQVGKQRRYDLLDTVRRYIAYLQEKCNSKGGNSKDDAENESRKIRADADLKATKAEIADMELQELKGEMHRSEDVEAMTTDLVFTIRGMMLALPGRLAIDLANINNPTEISERIKQEVHAILLELSNYSYDSDAYKKRVRDRQGWGELTKDSDDE
jgi:phage terminase Nu1 subunit (DNA packaging protein)